MKKGLMQLAATPIMTALAMLAGGSDGTAGASATEKAVAGRQRTRDAEGVNPAHRMTAANTKRQRRNRKRQADMVCGGWDSNPVIRRRILLRAA